MNPRFDFTADMFDNADEIYGYFSWLNRYYGLMYDEGLQPFLKAQSQQPGLRRAREAQFLATRTAAKKMNISPQSLSKLEQSEARGTISLNSLKVAAAALECELVYAIIPKRRVPFSYQIWKKLFAIASTDQRIKSLKRNVRASAIAEAANSVMNDAKFRRLQGWIQRGIRAYDSRWGREKITSAKVKKFIEAMKGQAQERVN